MKDDLMFLLMEDDLNFALGNLGSSFLECNIVSTQLDEVWKKTSNFLKMEDDLNFLYKEVDLNFALGNLGS